MEAHTLLGERGTEREGKGGRERGEGKGGREGEREGEGGREGEEMGKYEWVDMME